MHESGQAVRFGLVIEYGVLYWYILHVQCVCLICYFACLPIKITLLLLPDGVFLAFMAVLISTLPCRVLHC